MTILQWVICIWLFSGMAHILWLRLHGQKPYMVTGYIGIWASGLAGIILSWIESYKRKHTRL